MAEHKSVDLVLEGGGVKGIGLLGAVLTLADAGYRFERLAGTSAGAIVAALVAAYQKAGKPLHELEDVMGSMEYQKFEDSSLGWISDGAGLVVHQGMHTGDYLYEWLEPILADAGVRTFADLRLNDDPQTSLQDYQRYSLVVHTSDLTRQCLVRLPWDYDQYTQPADEQKVVDAVRASMSYPFFFRPVEFATGKGGEVTWVDGGLLSNYPITVFDRTDGKPARWPTWGVKLSAQPPDTDRAVGGSAVGLAFAMLETMLSEWDRYHLADEGVNRRTIMVDSAGISALDFGLSPENRQKLFDNGKNAATKFLQSQHGNQPTPH